MAYTPPDYGGYARSAADTQYKYTTDSATNAYGRFLSQQRGSRDLGDKYRNYQRSTPQRTSSLARRGVAGPGVSGGVMNQAMDRFVGDFARDYGRTQQDVTQQVQGYDMNQAALNQWRDRSLAEIEAEKRRAIANDASIIENIKAALGGLV